jgi:hypothetical protein
MPKYQVFNNGKPADTTGFPQLKGDGWMRSKFDTLEEARDYADDWVGFSLFSPDLAHVAGLIVLDKQRLKVGESYDYNGYGDTIEIREVE